MLGLVDAVVWVVDPEKYADAVLHERICGRLAGHAEVTFVVLNQMDRLPAMPWTSSRRSAAAAGRGRAGTGRARGAGRGRARAVRADREGVGVLREELGRARRTSGAPGLG